MTELPSVKALCVYSDKTGKSHFADVALPAMVQNGATVTAFIVGDAPSEKDWHVAGMAGLSIVLSGAWEIEAGSGDRRVLGIGSVLLMLDTEGQGHRSKTSGCTVLGVGIDASTRKAFSGLIAHLV